MAMILIVDDELYIGRLFRTILEKKANCQATSVTTVDDALDYISSHQVDAIILDLNLKGKNGSYLLDVLNMSNVNQKIPVVIVSAMAYDSMKNLMGAKGVKAYFSKSDVMDQAGMDRFAHSIQEIVNVAN